MMLILSFVFFHFDLGEPEKKLLGIFNLYSGFNKIRYIF